MLVIRKAQMDAFARGMLREFGRRVVRELRAAHPAVMSKLSSGETARRLDRSLERCEHYGIAARPDVRTFVNLSFLISSGFDRHPPFEKWLSNRTQPAGARLDTVLAKATENDWRAASKLTAAGSGARGEASPADFATTL